LEGLAIDTLLVCCGVWCGPTSQRNVEVDDHFVWHPKGTPFDQGAHFDHFALDLGKIPQGALASSNDGRPLERGEGSRLRVQAPPSGRWLGRGRVGEDLENDEIETTRCKLLSRSRGP
jgi:hypothetical protein